MRGAKAGIRTGMQAIREKRIPVMLGKRVTAIMGHRLQAAGQVMGFLNDCLGLVSEVGEMSPFGPSLVSHNEALLEAPPYPARRPRLRSVSRGYGDIGTRAIVNSLRGRLDIGGGSGSKIVGNWPGDIAYPPRATGLFATIPMVCVVWAMTRRKRVTLTDARSAGRANFNPFGRLL